MKHAVHRAHKHAKRTAKRKAHKLKAARHRTTHHAKTAKHVKKPKKI